MADLLLDEHGESAVPSARELEAIQQHRQLLTRLQHSVALQRGDVGQALREVTEAASQMLRVERTSVWRFDASRSRIDCIDLYRRSEGDHHAGATLAEASCPAYFRALREERTLAADDAGQDARTCELRRDYLVAHGIGAMLDAPVFVGDEMLGVVCHEHVGPPRHWHLWEELVAGTVADFVSFAFLSQERRRHEEELRRHRDELEQTVQQRTRQLRASEESFRALFEACPIPLVLSAAADRRILGINRRASEVLGVGVDQAVGLLPADFYVSPEEGRALLDLVARDGFAYDVSARLRTHDGREMSGLVSAQRVVVEGRAATLAGIQDITRQQQTEALLRELATRNPLLDLLNRRRFFEIAAQEVERARRYGRPTSLAMIDVDHFKAVNDEHGHAVGDRVLVALAAICAASVRQSDVLARYGGEEIVALLPETELPEATRVLERLRAAIDAAAVETSAGPLHVTVSAGVVARRGEETLEELLARADRALYDAKAQGRNVVVAAEA